MVISRNAFLFILGAVACERCFELWLSCHNARRSTAQGAIEVGQIHYRIMVVFHSLFFLSAAYEAVYMKRGAAPGVSYVALTGAIVAQLLRYWAVVTLGERWNTRIIVVPDAPPITGGPYRFVRHPNYLAVVIEMVALPMIYGCWFTATVFSVGNAILLAIRIPIEEEALGIKYKKAFAETPRLLPRLWRRGTTG